ncbi:MAG: acyl-CoA dehydrogenase [Dehalococcoidia bacterium]|nr:acyl-CoA dehydrogenase [Dehalococcoidia bacterium]
MDFTPSEEQVMFRRSIREFASKEIEPYAAKNDETGEFSLENVRKLGEMGLLGLTTPEEYGGMGGSAVDFAIAAEEISRADASMGTLLSVANSLFNFPMYRFGNEEQKQRHLVPVARGEKLGAYGLTEPNAGSDAASLQTSAVRDGDCYVLNGSKAFITCGDVADSLIVFTSTDKSQGSRGITAFIVEKAMRGFTPGKREKKLGICASPTVPLFFDDCRVPVENRLGDEGFGFKIAMQTLDGGRIGIASQALGIAQAAFEAALSYAKTRKQFGQPIAEFQAIKWMLADMATQIDAARLLTLRCADLRDRGLPHAKEASMAKLFASETAMAVATKAVQIHGGVGYTKDFPVERYFRDAKITEIYEGTSEVQRLVISNYIIRS